MKYQSNVKWKSSIEVYLTSLEHPDYEEAKLACEKLKGFDVIEAWVSPVGKPDEVIKL